MGDADLSGMVTNSIRQYLTDHHVPFRELSHKATIDAQRTAESAHVSGKCFAKTVVIMRGDQPILVVLPAHEWVDLEGLSDVLGGPIRFSSEDEFKRLFPDCEVGAVPPFGQLYHLPTVAHACLGNSRRFVANGGTHTDAIELEWEDFVALEHPRLVEHREQAKV